MFINKNIYDNNMKKLFSKKGQAMNMSFVLSFVVIMGVATVLTVLTSVISAKTYSISQSDLAAITDAGISGYVNDTIEAGFEAAKTGNEFLPIMYIGFVMAIVIGLIFSVMAVTTMGGRGGGSVL